MPVPLTAAWSAAEGFPNILLQWQKKVHICSASCHAALKRNWELCQPYSWVGWSSMPWLFSAPLPPKISTSFLCELLDWELYLSFTFKSSVTHWLTIFRVSHDDWQNEALGWSFTCPQLAINSNILLLHFGAIFDVLARTAGLGSEFSAEYHPVGIIDCTSVSNAPPLFPHRN